MILVIDKRERDLINALVLQNIEHRTDVLDIGDIWIYNEDNIHTIIERKTMNDLRASIIDSRYMEQKIRLREKSNEGVRILYLLEGCPDKSELNGGVASAALSVGTEFGVITSNSPSTSAYQLGKLVVDKNHVTNTHSSILAVQNLKKKDYITSQTCLESALCIIPGISHKIASRISQEYSSIRDLLAAEAKVADLVVGKRKIGVVIESKIIEMFGIKTK